MHPAFAFLAHRWRSKSRHGLHSPFIYSLVDQCVYAHAPAVDARVERHFSALKRDARLLKGMDHGQGKETIRSVADYAKTSAMPDVQAELLHRLAAYLKPMKALELGTNLGKSLSYMATGFSKGSFVGVEGNPALADHASDSLKILGIENANITCNRFDEVLKDASLHYDWVFLDGDHAYEPTMRYFLKLKERMAVGGVMIFHDIYHSPGMERAWTEIKKDRDVQVTLDLFFFGLVWLGLPQAKEDFSIRFPRSLFGLL